MLSLALRRELVSLEEEIYKDGPKSGVASYIDEGAESYAYSLRDNPTIVVKLPKSESRRPGWGERIRWAHKLRQRLVPGLGCVGVEQLIDSSNLFPTVVLTKHGGETLDKLFLDDNQEPHIFDVPKSHYTRLHETYIEMQRRGLSTDETPQNHSYRPGEGFTVIDYKTAKESPQSLEKKVLHFASSSMLSMSLKPEMRVPGQIVEYRNTASEVHGDAMASAIDKLWRDQGLIVPY